MTSAFLLDAAMGRFQIDNAPLIIAYTHPKFVQITGRAGFSLPSHSFDTIQEAPENIPKVRYSYSWHVQEEMILLIV